MTRLSWDAAGERYYESGVDRGVLYVDGTGVAWPGLVAVSESPTGGDATPHYIDGYKYLNVASAEEFEATIQAFSAPSKFAPCDGMNQMYNGLLITQQPRKPFGFAYRTRVGNDTDGLDHGYKIHLVYNALAAPSSRTNTTIGESAEAAVLSWDITTLAPRISGYRPTAHFIVDSRTTSVETLLAIENWLYGTDDTPSSQPTVTELLTIFGAPVYDAGEFPLPYGDTILDGGLP